MQQRKEPEALQLLSDYYRDNKKQSPTTVSDFREEIVDLLKKGKTPEEAFSLAQGGAA